MGVGHRMRAHVVYTGPRACGNEDKAMMYCVALEGTTSWGANTHLSKSFLILLLTGVGMCFYTQGEGDFLAPMYCHTRRALHNINQSTGEGER